jgi:hypothetical protein
VRKGLEVPPALESGETQDQALALEALTLGDRSRSEGGIAHRSDEESDERTQAFVRGARRTARRDAA